MDDLRQALKDFVATSNSGKYSDFNTLMSKFPELAGIDTNALKDFVATSNSGKYKSEEDLFSKFPEFSKKKEESALFSREDGTLSATPGTETQKPSASFVKGKVKTPSIFNKNIEDSDFKKHQELYRSAKKAIESGDRQAFLQSKKSLDDLRNSYGSVMSSDVNLSEDYNLLNTLSEEKFKKEKQKEIRFIQEEEKVPFKETKKKQLEKSIEGYESDVKYTPEERVTMLEIQRELLESVDYDSIDGEVSQEYSTYSMKPMRTKIGMLSIPQVEGQANDAIKMAVDELVAAGKEPSKEAVLQRASEIRKEEVKNKREYEAIDDKYKFSSIIGKSEDQEQKAQALESIKKKRESHAEMFRSKVSQLEAFEGQVKQYEELAKEQGGLSDIQKTEALDVLNKYKRLASDITKNYSNIENDTENIGDFDAELDAFKRNHTYLTSASVKSLAALEKIAGGIAGGAGMVNNIMYDLTGNAEFYLKANDLLGIGKGINESAQGMLDGVSKSKQLEDVKDAGDAIEWAGALMVENTPQILINVLTNGQAIPFLSASAAGEKYMEIYGDDKYSNLQKYAASILVGAGTAVSEKLELAAFNKLWPSKRLAKAAIEKTGREAFEKSLSEGVKKGISDVFSRSKKALAGVNQEGVSEVADQLSRNLVDKYVLDREDVSITDGLGEAYLSGAVVGAGLGAAPHVFSSVVRPFVNDPNKDILKNVNKIQKLNESLATADDKMKPIIQERIDQLRGRNEEIIQKAVNSFDSLSPSEVKEAIKIYEDITSLKKEYSEIKEDTTIPPDVKEALLESVFTKYNSLVERRLQILKKAEENAVQEQTTGEVPVQPEATVGEEVAQGEPQAGPEVTTEEEIKIDVPSIVANSKSEVDTVVAADLKEETGQTFNIDGTVYSDGGLVVPVVSENLKQEELTPERIADFVEKNKGKIGSNAVKVGIYKFPNKKEVSIDLNIVVPRNNREAALEFGKIAGQESLFDLDTFENIKTGSDGKSPRNFTDEEFRRISKELEEGRVPETGQQQTLAAEQGTPTTIEGTGLRENIKKSIAKVFKSFDAKSFKNAKEMAAYAKAKFNQETGATDSARIFVGSDGKVEVLVNEELADDTAFGHEVWHALLLKAFGDNQAKFADFRGAIDKTLRQNGYEDIADSLDEFSSQYTEEGEVPAEEYLAQLGGLMTSANIDLKNLTPAQKSLLQQIKDIINDFAIQLTGQPVFLKEATPETILDFMSTMSDMMAKGEDISGLFADEAGRVIDKNDVTINTRASKKVKFKNNKFETKQPIFNPKSGKATGFTFIADRMATGEWTGLDPKSGIKIPLMGGIGYPMLKKMYKKVGWAVEGGTVMSTFLRKIVKSKTGIGFPVLMSEYAHVSNLTFAKIFEAEMNWMVKSGQITQEQQLDNVNKYISEALIATKDLSPKMKPDKNGKLVDKNANSPLRTFAIESDGKYTPKVYTSMDQLYRDLEGTFDARGLFMKTLIGVGVKNRYAKIEKYGFPDMVRAADETSDPRLKGIPSGTSVSAIQFNKEKAAEFVSDIESGAKLSDKHSAKSIGVDAHISYQYPVEGESLGWLTGVIEMSEAEGVDENTKAWYDDQRKKYKEGKISEAQLRSNVTAKSRASMPEVEIKTRAQKVEKIQSETNFVPVSFWVESLKGNVDYLDNVIEHILKAREILKSGKVPQKMTTKSYLITLSSMGSGGGYYDNWKAKTGKTVEDIFIEKQNGREWLRPEGAAAAFLSTPEGKALVEKINEGTATKEEIKEIFDFVGTGRESSKAEYVISTIQSGGLKSMTDLFNKNKGEDFSELFAGAIKNLKGIGEGKTGFFNQYFGVSSRGVVDARQMNAWVSGQMKLTDEQKLLKKKIESSPKLQAELLKKIEEVGLELGYPEDLAAYIAHHAIWDAIAKNITKHEGEYIVTRAQKKDRDSWQKNGIKYTVGDIIDGSKLDELSGDLVDGKKGDKYILTQEPLSNFTESREELLRIDPEYKEEESFRLDSMKDNFEKTPPIPPDGDGMHRIIAAKELGFNTILMWKKLTDYQSEVKTRAQKAQPTEATETDFVLPFGKYKGQWYTTTPKAYRDFLSKQDWFDPRKYLVKTLEKADEAFGTEDGEANFISRAQKIDKKKTKEISSSIINSLTDEEIEKAKSLINNVEAPKKTTKAYKLFKVKKEFPGELFPLFVGANESVTVGEWIEAKEGEIKVDEKTGKKTVKSTLGPLAYRPGWHSGDSPMATHIGSKAKKEDKKPSFRSDDHVWAEVEVGDDFDWQKVATERAEITKQGKINVSTAHITDQVPLRGFYRYKTNPNMTGNWIISGEMKVNRVLTEKEVQEINKKSNAKDLPRVNPFNYEAYGFNNDGSVKDPKKVSANQVARAYQVAKETGENPELVKAVESKITTRAQKAQPSTIPGYDRMIGEAKGIVSKSKKRGVSADQIAENVINYIQKSKVYERADDLQREQIIRDARKDLGLRQKSAPRVDRILGIKDSVSTEDKKNLMEVIKAQVKATNNLVKAQKEIAKQINKEIRELKEKGKITTSQMIAALRRLSEVDLLNEESVSNFLDYVARVFKDAAYYERVTNINRKRRAAKNSAATKIGIADGLTPLLQKIFSIDARTIPEKALNAYEELVNMFADRSTVLQLADIEKVTKMAKEVFEAVEGEVERARSLAEVLSNYDNMATDENGNIEFSKTVDQMVNDGSISAEDGELMKKYKSMILEEAGLKKEKDVRPEEEIEEERQQLVETVKNYTPVFFQLPTQDERNVARDIFRLIKTGAIDKMSNKDLKDLLRIIDNIERGFLPHSAQIMKERMNQINNGETLSGAVNNAKMLPVESRYGKIKALFGGSAIRKAIDRNPLFFIDELFRNFKSTPIFDSIFKPISRAFSSYQSEVNTINRKIQNAMDELSNSLGKNPNKVQFAKQKIMAYMLESEYQANPNSKEVRSAKDFLDATIKYAEESEQNSYSDKDIENLKKIRDEFFSGETVDLEAMLESFSPAEKKAIKTIADINNELSTKVAFTSTIIRGRKVGALNNYIHHNTLGERSAADIATNVSMADVFNASMRPSTKAKSLIERTGTATPLVFDPFSSTTRGARQLLMDYHLTEPIRTARRTVKYAESKVTGKQKRILNAISGALEQALSNTLINTYHETTFVEDAIRYMEQTGYRAMLGSIPRAVAELTSNLSYVMLYDPASFTSGISKYRSVAMSEAGLSVMKNVKSQQTERLYPASKLSGRGLDREVMSQASGIKAGKSQNDVMNAMTVVYNYSGKQVKNFAEATADALIGSPDKAVMKPLWFGAFAAEFKKATGQDVDYDKIANNNEAYLTEFSEAIDQAAQHADETSVRVGASDNPFTGILKGANAANQSAMKQAFNKFNNFMSRFLIYEYTTARTGVYALMGNGKLTQKQGAAILGATMSRMIVYSLLSKELVNIMMGMLGFGDDEEEDKTFFQKLGQATASAFSGLILGRNFGNFTKAPINIGVEKVNEKFLDFLREGDYDPYEDAIQYTIIPKDERKQGDIMEYVKSFSGAFSPMIGTAQRTLQVFARDPKTKAAQERRLRELSTRTPLEILGNTGYIPLYRDVRKIVMESLYEDMRKGSKKKGSSGIKTSIDTKIK